MLSASLSLVPDVSGRYPRMSTGSSRSCSRFDDLGPGLEDSFKDIKIHAPPSWDPIPGLGQLPMYILIVQDGYSDGGFVNFW